MRSSRGGSVEDGSGLHADGDDLAARLQGLDGSVGDDGGGVAEEETAEGGDDRDDPQPPGDRLRGGARGGSGWCGACVASSLTSMAASCRFEGSGEKVTSALY
ncbi:hypothetical protein GCM10009680_36450 [Streptomyces yatensis]|uniref:Uncharacterized protein n=1 Tax=Streptomyces yatensis TaxID=155177 RepID=A0ABN2HU09_9ACTN